MMTGVNIFQIGLYNVFVTNITRKRLSLRSVAKTQMKHKEKLCYFNGNNVPNTHNEIENLKETSSIFQDS